MMIDDCPLCDEQMKVQFAGLSIPDIVCPNCEHEFGNNSDWWCVTSLRHVRRKARRLNLRCKKVRLRIGLWYLALLMKWCVVKIRFYEYVLSVSSQTTPKHSETITGIEVTKDDE